MNDLKTDLTFLGIWLTAFTLPFGLVPNSVAIIISVLPVSIGLISDPVFRLRIWHNLKQNPIALAMMAFALLYALLAAWHWPQYSALDPLLKHLEMRLPFLLLPLAMAIVPGLSPGQIKRLLQAFMAGVLLSSLILLLSAAWVSVATGSLYNLHSRYNIQENNFMYHRLGSYLNLHAVYYSAMVLLAFVIAMVYWRHRFAVLSRPQRLGLLLVLAYLLVLLFLLKSATILISLVVIVISYGLYLLGQYRSRLRIWQSAGILAILLGLTIVFGVRIADKVGARGSIFSYDFLQPGGGEWNVFNLRKAKWDVALEAIGDYWLTGTGPALAQETLDTYYARHLFINALQHHYNAHNQFLQSFLTLGVAGGLLLLYIYGASFYRAVCRADLVAILFLLGFTLFSISESTLEVNKGIVLFAWFVSFFSYLPARTAIYFYE